MLTLSKILFFNTGINQLFKKQNEMSSFYSHFWKKNEERQVENIPADDLNTYISKFIIATESRRPWKRLKSIEDSPEKKRIVRLFSVFLFVFVKLSQLGYIN